MSPGRRRIDNPDRAFDDAKTAPASGTPLALSYLESYLDDKSNRKQATMALLGCSERTAGRIASRKQPYTAAMKMEWVYRICAAVGRPMGEILGSRSPKSWRQCMLGWNHARNAAEAIQFASDCALSIVYRAFTHFKLTGSFAVSYEGGYPREVAVFLSPMPEVSVMQGEFGLHRVVVTSERVSSGGRKRMFIQHICPVQGMLDKTFLTPEFLEEILVEIHALTKNIPARLQRESTRSPA